MLRDVEPLHLLLQRDPQGYEEAHQLEEQVSQDGRPTERNGNAVSWTSSKRGSPSSRPELPPMAAVANIPVSRMPVIPPMP